MCIPQYIEGFFLGIAFVILLFINWFVVLFTGEYWDTAYTFFLGVMRFSTKITLFLYGITDKYPGFDLDSNGIFELDIQKPKSPSRWLAIPFIGFFVRLILLIPYYIFTSVMERGAGVGVFISWFAVLFKNLYPESLYEFERDSVRVSLATSTYLSGLSDKYPSFYISMNHKNIKIALIIAGALLVIFNWISEGRSQPTNVHPQYNQMYDKSAPDQSAPDLRKY
jgi:hypothetical protein